MQRAGFAEVRGLKESEEKAEDNQSKGMQKKPI